MSKSLSERLAELEFRAAGPGMKEVWLPMYPTELAALIREAAALARRVEGAAVTPISTQTKASAEIPYDWSSPLFETTYAKLIPCDESGALVPVEGEA